MHRLVDNGDVRGNLTAIDLLEHAVFVVGPWFIFLRLAHLPPLVVALLTVASWSVLSLGLNQWLGKNPFVVVRPKPFRNQPIHCAMVKDRFYCRGARSGLIGLIPMRKSRLEGFSCPVFPERVYVREADGGITRYTACWPWTIVFFYRRERLRHEEAKALQFDPPQEMQNDC